MTPPSPFTVASTEQRPLVGRDGSIDWLCLPRFGSGGCFAALLGTPDNGPAGHHGPSCRRYRPDTLVLEIEFSTGEGTVRVADCMPIRDGAPHPGSPGGRRVGAGTDAQ